MNWRRRNRPEPAVVVADDPEPSVAEDRSTPDHASTPATSTVEAPVTGDTRADLATPPGEIGQDAAEGPEVAPEPDDTIAGAKAHEDAISPAVAGLEPVDDPPDEEATRRAVILTVLNQKGGVGKTTTTVSLGAALAEDGLSVLVVDLDPQGNATTGLGLRVQDGAPSTYRVVVEGLDAEQATEATSVRGLHVLPSSLDLAGAEIELVPQFSRESRLRKALDAVRDLYDVILVDCPPSLGLLTINGLVAADQVIVPIQCEYYALEGLGQLLRTVELVRSSLNAELELCGVLMTMYDGRTNLSQQVVDEVRSHFGEQAFKTIIPRTVRLSEAPSYGQPITVFDPSSRGARAYQRLSSELTHRLGLRTASAGTSALDRLLGTAPVVDGGDEHVPPPPPVPPSEPTGPRPLPTDLDRPPPPPPGVEDDEGSDVPTEHISTTEGVE